MAEEHSPRRSPAYPAIDPRKLTELRHRRAVSTQAQLAQMTGLSRATISLLETGKRRLSTDTLRKLCTALQCEPDDILISTEEGNNATTHPPAGSAGNR